MARRLRKAAEDLDQDSIGDPLAVAEMQQRLGESLVSLGFARDGIPLIQTALDVKTEELGIDDLEVLKAASDLGYAYNHNEQQDLAVGILEEAAPRLSALLGPDHKTAVTAQKRLGFAYIGTKKFDLALQVFALAMDMETERWGEDAEKPTLTLVSIAGINLSLGNIDLAKQQYRKAIRLLETADWVNHPEQMYRAFNGQYRAIARLARKKSVREEAQRYIDSIEVGLIKKVEFEAGRKQ